MIETTEKNGIVQTPNVGLANTSFRDMNRSYNHVANSPVPDHMDASKVNGFKGLFIFLQGTCWLSDTLARTKARDECPTMDHEARMFADTTLTFHDSLIAGTKAMVTANTYVDQQTHRELLRDSECFRQRLLFGDALLIVRNSCIDVIDFRVE